MKTVTQQIAWMEKQIKNMEKAIPAAVKDGRLSVEHADDKMDCANSTLQTLKLLRAVVRGEGSTT